MDSLTPVTSQGADIVGLFWVVLVLAAGVFLLVSGLLLVAVLRFRRRADEPLAEPGRDAGNRRLEILWTLGPILLVSVLFVMAVRTMRTVSAQDTAGGMDIAVTGRQWWWEYRYPSAGPEAVTANELRLPAGVPVRLQLTSADVIHSFWVPQFGWKQDALPGRTNPLPVRVDQPGVYDGVCAEYCGTQHGWMRIRVIVEPPDRFQAWLDALRAPAVAPASPQGQRGQQVFLNSTCISCHAIRGTSAAARVGPDLTHVGARGLLGSGVAENTPESLYRWVRNAQEVKPGVLMPAYTQLPEGDLRALAAYLSELK